MNEGTDSSRGDMKPAGRVMWENDKEDIEEKWLALGKEAGGRENKSCMHQRSKKDQISLIKE